MKNLANILVGIDFSECSASAIREAVRIAEWDGAQLTAIHVLERDLRDQIQTHLRFEELEVLKRTEDRLVAFVEDTIGPGHPCRCRIEVGHPFDRLLHAVQEQSADLLVLGTEGLTQDRRATGVIASKCVRQIPIPILLVREFQNRPFQKIAVCVDFSESSKRALEQAAHIAVRDRASLELLHVIQPIGEMVADMAAFAQVVPPAPFPLGDYVARARKDLEEFAAPCRPFLAGVPVSFEVIERVGVSDAIIAHLKESRAELAVLGTHGRTGLKSLLMGTTAEKVLREVPCSALAVRLPENRADETEGG